MLLPLLAGAKLPRVIISAESAGKLSLAEQGLSWSEYALKLTRKNNRTNGGVSR